MTFLSAIMKDFIKRFFFIGKLRGHPKNMHPQPLTLRALALALGQAEAQGRLYCAASLACADNRKTRKVKGCAGSSVFTAHHKS